jgi:WD40 repeat protein
MRRFLSKYWRAIVYPAILLGGWLVISIGIWGPQVFLELPYYLVFVGDQRASYRAGPSCSCVCFTPDGTRLLVAQRSSVAFLDSTTARECCTLIRSGVVRAIAISPDGKYLYVGGDCEQIDQYDFATLKLIKRLLGSLDTLKSIALAPDGRILASSTYNGREVKLWDTAKSDLQEPRTLAGHTQPVAWLAVSPDGRKLASASYDGTAKIWDLASAKVVATLRGHSAGVSSVCYSPNGNLLATGGSDGDGVIVVWDARTNQLVRKLEGDNGCAVHSIAFAPDSKVMASTGLHGHINLWDVSSGRKAHILRGHTDVVRSLVFSPDGKSLASAGRDGTVRLWDVPSD